MANQYASRKGLILAVLADVRHQLTGARAARGSLDGALRAAWYLANAQRQMRWARRLIDAAPASTRRRWACGR